MHSRGTKHEPGKNAEIQNIKGNMDNAC